MALPGDLTTATITFGPYTDAAGAVALVGVKAKLFPVNPVNGKRLNLVHVATGQAVLPKDLLVTIGADGTASVGPVPHTDNAGLSTVGFAYRVEWAVTSSARTASPGHKTFAVPTASGATVDFDLLDVADAVPGVLVPVGTGPQGPQGEPGPQGPPGEDGAGAVESVNGQVGVVELDAADVGAQPAGDYATASDLSNGLATKVNSSTYTAGLAGKGNLAGDNVWTGAQDFTGATVTGVGGGATTKTSVVHIGGSGTQTASTTTTFQLLRTPVRVPQTTTRWRVKVGGEDMRGDAAVTTSMPLDGVWFGEAVLSALGAMTSATKAAPVQVLGASTIPADAAPVVGDWITDPALQLIAGRIYLLSYSINGTGKSVVWGSGWTYAKSGASSLAADNALAAPTGLGVGTSVSVLDVEIEYECETDRASIMCIGDSLTDGARSDYGSFTSWPTFFGQLTGCPVLLNSYSGASTTNWTNLAHRKYTRYAGLDFDAIVLMIGTNDILSGTTLATLQANYLTVLSNIRTVWGADVPIYGATLPPITQTDTRETARTGFNAWLRAAPHGLAGVVDFDRVIRDPATLTAIAADYAQGDGVHLKAAGTRALALAMPHSLRVAAA